MIIPYAATPILLDIFNIVKLNNNIIIPDENSVTKDGNPKDIIFLIYPNLILHFISLNLFFFLIK